MASPSDSVGDDLPGQTAAVGADERQGAVGQLEQDAAEGVAGALDVGGKHRAADRPPQVGGGGDVVGRGGEVGHVGEEVRVLARQLELGVQAADDQALAVRLQGQFLVVGRAEDLAEPLGRQNHGAGLIDLHAEHPVADAHLQVGGQEGGAFLRVGHELDVLEDRLRAPGGHDPADHSERLEQVFAIAQGLHACVSLPRSRQVGVRLAIWRPT